MFVPPNKHGFVFSWDHCKSQEKLETMLMQNLGGQTKSIMVFSEVAYWRNCKTNQITESSRGGGGGCLSFLLEVYISDFGLT